MSSLRRSASRRASRSARARAASRCGDGAAGELPADHRGALEHRALLGSQALDAGREQRMDRRRHLERRRARAPTIQRSPSRGERPVVDQHAHQLADEQRVALAGRAAPRPATAPAARRAPSTFGGEPRRRAGVEAVERRSTSAHEPPGVASDERSVAQLGPRARRARSSGTPRAPLHEVLDEIEQQRLGPVQVVDHQHHRLRSRASAGQHAPHDEERLLGRPRASRYRGARPCRSTMRSRSGSSSAAGRGDERCTTSAPARRRRFRACARSASASGANVAPPAASQCAREDRRSSPRRCASSASSRVLPRPGDPSTVTRRAASRRGSASTARRARSSSSSRPTNGAAVASCAGRVERRAARYAGDRARRGPSASSSPSGASVTASATRRRVASPITTSPSAAPAPGAAPRRSPGRRRCRRRPSLTTTSPVLTRDAQARVGRQRSARPAATARERLLHRAAARTARTASSSATCGHAERGHDAVAEQLHDACRRARRRRRAAPRSSASMSGRADSGSSRSCSAVEPTRSANTIVTTLRASSAAGPEAADIVPHRHRRTGRPARRRIRTRHTSPSGWRRSPSRTARSAGWSCHTGRSPPGRPPVSARYCGKG